MAPRAPGEISTLLFGADGFMLGGGGPGLPRAGGGGGGGAAINIEN
jgi:hypothetical protein